MTSRISKPVHVTPMTPSANHARQVKPAAMTIEHLATHATATPLLPSVVIAGGSGFIGQHLANHLKQSGYRVIVLTRQAVPSTPAAGHDQHPSISHVYWDGKTTGAWTQALEGAAAVINLAGRNVNCRYTARHRQAILDSRLDSVAALDAAIRACNNPPPVWVQAATLAIYGDRGDQLLTEASHIGSGFSPDVAQAWENAVLNAGLIAGLHPTRKVILRISFVLGQGGGALPTLARLAKLGLGGSVGDGQQYYSWIHIDDLCTIIHKAILAPNMTGVFNVTSPQPVRNKIFMRLLRQAVCRPWSPPAPAWAVRVGCVLMRTEAELALRSRYGLPARLQVMGHRFKFNTLAEAFADLFPRSTHQAKHPKLTRVFEF